MILWPSADSPLSHGIRGEIRVAEANSSPCPIFAKRMQEVREKISGIFFNMITTSFIIVLCQSGSFSQTRSNGKIAFPSDPGRAASIFFTCVSGLRQAYRCRQRRCPMIRRIARLPFRQACGPLYTLPPQLSVSPRRSAHASVFWEQIPRRFPVSYGQPPSPPESTGALPPGSTATIFTSDNFSLNASAQPVIVPPVPTPATKISTSSTGRA